MRNIILTGSTGGLGVALSKELAVVEDSKLICVYRNETKYEEVIKNANIDAEGYCTCMADSYADLCVMLDGSAEEIILILNAFAITPIKNIGTYTDDEIDTMIDGNIKTNVKLVNAVTGWCKANDKLLRVINIDSGAADFPLKGWANYGASKAYMNLFLSVLNAENDKYKVVSFDPGVMDTKMQVEIRSTSKEIFDIVDNFIGYKEDGVLKAPADVAVEIVDRYVKNWKAAELRE